MFEQVLRLKYQHVGTCPSFLVSIGNLCLPSHLTNGSPPLLPPHPPSPPAMAIAAIRKERQLCQNSFDRTHDSCHRAGPWRGAVYRPDHYVPYRKEALSHGLPDLITISYVLKINAAYIFPIDSSAVRSTSSVFQSNSSGSTPS